MDDRPTPERIRQRLRLVRRVARIAERLGVLASDLAMAAMVPASSRFSGALPSTGSSANGWSPRRALRQPPTGAHTRLLLPRNMIEPFVLAEYRSANGEVIAFSFIYNGRDRWNARYHTRLVIDNVLDEKHYISVAGGRVAGTGITAMPGRNLRLTTTINW